MRIPQFGHKTYHTTKGAHSRLEMCQAIIGVWECSITLPVGRNPENVRILYMEMVHSGISGDRSKRFYQNRTKQERDPFLPILFFTYLFYLFIYSSIHISNKKIFKKTFNVHISAVWTKWPTQGQATYVPSQHYYKQEYTIAHSTSSTQ